MNDVRYPKGRHTYPIYRPYKIELIFFFFANRHHYITFYTIQKLILILPTYTTAHTYNIQCPFLIFCVA